MWRDDKSCIASRTLNFWNYEPEDPIKVGRGAVLVRRLENKPNLRIFAWIEQRLGPSIRHVGVWDLPSSQSGCSVRYTWGVLGVEIALSNKGFMPSATKL